MSLAQVMAAGMAMAAFGVAEQACAADQPIIPLVQKLCIDPGGDPARASAAAGALAAAREGALRTIVLVANPNISVSTLGYGVTAPRAQSDRHD